MTNQTKLVIIGLGNIEREDDGIGIYFCEKIISQNILKNGIRVYTENNSTSLEDIIDEILTFSDTKNVILVDAADIGGIPGEYRWVNDVNDIQPNLSTHEVLFNFYMGYLVHKGVNVKLLAIQPQSLGFKRSLSPKLEFFLKTTFELVVQEIIQEQKFD